MKCSLGISHFLEEISSLSQSVVFLYFFALIAEDFFSTIENPGKALGRKTNTNDLIDFFFFLRVFWLSFGREMVAQSEGQLGDSCPPNVCRGCDGDGDNWVGLKCCGGGSRHTRPAAGSHDDGVRAEVTCVPSRPGP